MSYINRYFHSKVKAFDESLHPRGEDGRWVVKGLVGLMEKYDPNQPRDPAGSSTGGQWTSGGTWLTELSHPYNDKAFTAYKSRRATPEEEQRFIDHINETIPKDLLEFMPKDARPPILAITDDDFAGRYQGDWIFVPKDFADYGLDQHEFLHHVVTHSFGINSPGDEINRYNPSTYFSHASVTERGMEKNEDLTMMLQFYDPDPVKWSANIKSLHELKTGYQPMTDIDVDAKVAEARRFLDYTRWARAERRRRRGG